MSAEERVYPPSMSELLASCAAAEAVSTPPVRGEAGAEAETRAEPGADAERGPESEPEEFRARRAA